MKHCRNCAYGDKGTRNDPCQSCIRANRRLDNPYSRWRPEKRNTKKFENHVDSISLANCNIA